MPGRIPEDDDGERAGAGTQARPAVPPLRNGAEHEQPAPRIRFPARQGPAGYLPAGPCSCFTAPDSADTRSARSMPGHARFTESPCRDDDPAWSFHRMERRRTMLTPQRPDRPPGACRLCGHCGPSLFCPCLPGSTQHMSVSTLKKVKREGGGTAPPGPK